MEKGTATLSHVPVPPYSWQPSRVLISLYRSWKLGSCPVQHYDEDAGLQVRYHAGSSYLPGFWRQSSQGLSCLREGVTTASRVPWSSTPCSLYSEQHGLVISWFLLLPKSVLRCYIFLKYCPCLSEFKLECRIMGNTGLWFFSFIFSHTWSYSAFPTSFDIRVLQTF